MLSAPWGLNANTVCGLFLATLGPAGMEAPAPSAQGRAAFGTMDGLLVGRYLGGDAWEAKKQFIAAWKVWRQQVLGRQACPPRIWNT